MKSIWEICPGKLITTGGVFHATVNTGNTAFHFFNSQKLFDKVARKWGVDYAIRRVGDEKYLLLFKARQADAITGCFAEYSRLELKRAKSRQTPIREQLRQAEEKVKKQPQRELTKEAAHGDR